MTKHGEVFFLICSLISPGGDGRKTDECFLIWDFQNVGVKYGDFLISSRVPPARARIYI